MRLCSGLLTLENLPIVGAKSIENRICKALQQSLDWACLFIQVLFRQ
jgi:hypothetical protein